VLKLKKQKYASKSGRGLDAGWPRDGRGLVVGWSRAGRGLAAGWLRTGRHLPTRNSSVEEFFCVGRGEDGTDSSNNGIDVRI
jgi:hypothetical protein